MSAKYPRGYFTQPAFAWWPGFKSVTCDPRSEYFVFRNAAAIKAAELSAAAKAAQTAGKGWGDGTIDGVKRAQPGAKHGA